MQDSLSNVETWPQAGRFLLEYMLLSGKEEFLLRCLSGETKSTLSSQELKEALKQVQKKLATLGRDK